MKHQKILHLTLKKKWFDMIASGEKKEEYREIKPYWDARLYDKLKSIIVQYDIVRFTNGYAKDCPTMDIECREIKFDIGEPNWGAVNGKVYYVIQLGNILTIKNYNL